MLILSNKRREFKMNKDNAIEFLVNYNRLNKDSLITKLYYNEHDYGEDYSPFIDNMSDSLKESLKFRRTLTTEQENELDNYKIETIVGMDLAKC
jgi:hypothetical protein